MPCVADCSYPGKREDGGGLPDPGIIRFVSEQSHSEANRPSELSLSEAFECPTARAAANPSSWSTVTKQNERELEGVLAEKAEKQSK